MRTSLWKLAGVKSTWAIVIVDERLRRFDAISVLESPTSAGAIVSTYSRTFSAFAFTRSEGICSMAIAREWHAFFVETLSSPSAFLSATRNMRTLYVRSLSWDLCLVSGQGCSPFFKRSSRHALHLTEEKMDKTLQYPNGIGSIYCGSLGQRGCRRNGIFTVHMVDVFFRPSGRDLWNFGKGQDDALIKLASFPRFQSAVREVCRVWYSRLGRLFFIVEHG